MEFWQIGLILLFSIAEGVLVGTLLSHLVLRFARRRQTTFSSDLVARPVKKPFAEERQTTAAVEAQPKSTSSHLATEVEKNRKIASEPCTGRFLPFETDVWNANQHEVHKFPADFREDMIQVYADVYLANDIVWLSTKLTHTSKHLDEKYTILCTKIAARLDRLMPLLKRSVN